MNSRPDVLRKSTVSSSWLYKDNITGKLNNERFAKITADYEQKQASLNENTLFSKELGQCIVKCGVMCYTIINMIKMRIFYQQLIAELNVNRAYILWFQGCPKYYIIHFLGE